MMPLGSKLACPGDGAVGTNNQRRPTSKIFISEGRRALVFGMQHLVDLFQVCSYDALNQDWPRPRVHKFERRNKGGKIQNSSSLKL